MRYLDKDKFYMNPVTGSVDTGESWEADYFECDGEPESWEEWGGNLLIEVDEKVDNITGEKFWEEVK